MAEGARSPLGVGYVIEKCREGHRESYGHKGSGVGGWDAECRVSERAQWAMPRGAWMHGCEQRGWEMEMGRRVLT